MQKRKEIRPWTNFQRVITDKFSMVDARFEKANVVTTSYSQKIEKEADKNRNPIKHIHFRNAKEAARIGMPRTISYYAKDDTDELDNEENIVGQGVFHVVTKGPRDFVLRRGGAAVSQGLNKNPGTAASVEDYADLDSFVTGYEVRNGMEICRDAGVILNAYTEKNKIPFVLFRKSSQQLKELHMRNIYHLDIKPGNMTVVEREKYNNPTPFDIKFIDTDGMVQRKHDGSDDSHPKDNICTYGRDWDSASIVKISNKSDDEYAFLLTLIISESSTVKTICESNLNPKKDSNLQQGFEAFVRSRIKPAYRTEIMAFLTDPAQRILSSHLHDMIEWDDSTTERDGVVEN